MRIQVYSVVHSCQGRRPHTHPVDGGRNYAGGIYAHYRTGRLLLCMLSQAPPKTLNLRGCTYVHRIGQYVSTKYYRSYVHGDTSYVEVIFNTRMYYVLIGDVQ